MPETEERDFTHALHAEISYTPYVGDYHPYKVTGRDPETGKATAEPGPEDGDDLNLCRSCAETFVERSGASRETFLASNDPEIWEDSIEEEFGGLAGAWDSLEEEASDDGAAVYLACDECREALITITRSPA